MMKGGGIMNTLETCDIPSPDGTEEICGKFTISEVLSPFTLHDIIKTDETYTLALWIRSELDGEVLVRGNVFKTSTEWTRYEITFKASDKDLKFYFNTQDTYYIYKPKLEFGTKATDWTESPDDISERVDAIQSVASAAENLANMASDRLDDAESLIQQLNNCIATLVTDSNGSSLMTQTANGGWTFSMANTENTINKMVELIAELETSLGSTDATIEVLEKNIDDIESSIEWVKVTTYEDEPCIALGETDSDFKLLITNTRIMFMEGSSVPAYLSNKTLHIQKAVVEELQQGGYVWKIRSNGNMGLIWKGVDS